MKLRTQAGHQLCCGVRCTPYRFMLLCICALVLIAGCGEKEPPDVKQSRAIAAENMELEKDLARCKAQLQNQKDMYDKELEKQKKLLAECKRQRDEWKAKAKQNVRDQAEELVDPLMKEITRLREENTRLRAELKESKK